MIRVLFSWGGGSVKYKGRRWKAKRAYILSKDNYLDVVALRFWNREEEATIVHHIYPAEEYPEFRYCDWNLISVSRRTHRLLENPYTNDLTDLGRTLMKNTVPGVDWRKKM